MTHETARLCPHTKGGPSEPENGAVLRDFRHRLLHEGGFTPDHDFVFRSAPDACVSGNNSAPFALQTPSIAASS